MKYEIIEIGIIETYQSLVESVPYVLNSYDIKHSTIYESIGMSRSTWERRIAGNSFTVEEMNKIANFINERYT